MHADESWIVAQLAASDDESLRAVRRVHCVPLHGARSTSRHFRVELEPAPPGTPRLFLKLYGDGQADVDVVREAAALLWLDAQGFASSTARVPGVIAADPDRRMLLLTFHDGEPLIRRLYRTLWSTRVSARARGAAVSFARNVGRMLAGLQGLPRTSELQRVSSEAVLARYGRDMERRLARLSAAGMDIRALDNAWCSIPRESFARPLCLQHSDFGPWNLLVERNGGLVLFDFHNFTAGHPAYDLAYMHLAIEGTLRMGLTPAVAVDRAQRALLEAYAECGGSLDATALRAFRIMHVAYFAHPLVTRRRSVRQLGYGARSGPEFASRWVRAVIDGG